MRFQCSVNSADYLEVEARSPGQHEEVKFTLHEYSYNSVVNLSSEDAMNLAAHIVRLVHGGRKPRVWEKFEDVPDRVEVQIYEDCDELPFSAMKVLDHTIYIDAEVGAEPWDFDLHHPNDYAPFVEVL